MKKGIWLLVTACLTLPVAACGGDELKGGDSSSSGGDKSNPAITVGSANFPENVVLAEVYAGALEAKKFDVTEEARTSARALRSSPRSSAETSRCCRSTPGHCSAT